MAIIRDVYSEAVELRITLEHRCVCLGEVLREASTGWRGLDRDYCSLLGCLFILGRACRSVFWQLRLGLNSLIYRASTIARRLLSLHVAIISVFSSRCSLSSVTLCVFAWFLGAPLFRW